MATALQSQSYEQLYVHIVTMSYVVQDDAELVVNWDHERWGKF